MNLLSFYSNSADLQTGSPRCPHEEIKVLWQRTLDELATTMTQATFYSLLNDSVPSRLFSDTLVVVVPSSQSADWLNHRLRDKISRTLASLAGTSLNVLFVSRSEHNVSHPAEAESHPRTLAREKAPECGRPSASAGEVDGDYRTIVQPHRVEVSTQYFRQHWRPLLGPLLSELVRELRQRSYDQNGSDGQEAIVEISQKELAESLGVSRSTIARALARDAAGNFKHRYLDFFIQEIAVPTSRDSQGRLRNDKTRFLVRIDEPLTPTDQRRLAANIPC